MAFPLIEMDALSVRRRRAAILVADGRMTNDQIAADVGVSPSTLAKWKRCEDFRIQVEHMRPEVREQVLLQGFATKANRMWALDDLYLRLQQIIDERAADPAMRRIPGGDSGLIKRNVKNIGSAAKPKIIEIGEMDHVLIHALEAILNQAEKEENGF